MALAVMKLQVLRRFCFRGEKFYVLRPPAELVISSNLGCVLKPRKSATFFCGHTLSSSHKTQRLLFLSVNFPQFTTEK
jgi:hypothetical protein